MSEQGTLVEVYGAERQQVSPAGVEPLVTSPTAAQLQNEGNAHVIRASCQSSAVHGLSQPAGIAMRVACDAHSTPPESSAASGIASSAEIPLSDAQLQDQLPACTDLDIFNMVKGTRQRSDLPDDASDAGSTSSSASEQSGASLTSARSIDLGDLHPTVTPPSVISMHLDAPFGAHTALDIRCEPAPAASAPVDVSGGDFRTPSPAPRRTLLHAFEQVIQPSRYLRSVSFPPCDGLESCSTASSEGNSLATTGCRLVVLDPPALPSVRAFSAPSALPNSLAHEHILDLHADANLGGPILTPASESSATPRRASPRADGGSNFTFAARSHATSASTSAAQTQSQARICSDAPGLSVLRSYSEPVPTARTNDAART
ncbi:hypothetical protein EON66_10570, partial [archaeon]